MFATTETVSRLTGYSVSAADIVKAQGIIETYIGRVEADVTDSNDKSLLERATAYQTAYMKENPSLVFEQVAMIQHGQNESIATFDREKHSPFLAPNAAVAMKYLSWHRTRSVGTGTIFGKGRAPSWSSS